MVTMTSLTVNDIASPVVQLLMALYPKLSAISNIPTTIRQDWPIYPDKLAFRPSTTILNVLLVRMVVVTFFALVLTVHDSYFVEVTVINLHLDRTLSY